MRSLELWKRFCNLIDWTDQLPRLLVLKCLFRLNVRPFITDGFNLETVYVCVCIYIYICVYVCVFIYMCVCVCVCVCVVYCWFVNSSEMGMWSLVFTIL